MHIGFHGHHIMFQDCLESKDEREELKTVSGKVDIWIDKDIDAGFEDNMVIDV